MPGHHGKQRMKRKKSRRERPTEMETTLKDSIHGRTRNERAILSKLIPPVLPQLVRKVSSNNSGAKFTLNGESISYGASAMVPAFLKSQLKKEEESAAKGKMIAIPKAPEAAAPAAAAKVAPTKGRTPTPAAKVEAAPVKGATKNRAPTPVAASPKAKTSAVAEVAAASPKNRVPTPAAASPKAASPKAPVAEVAAASPKNRAPTPAAASPKAASPKAKTSAVAEVSAASSPKGRASAVAEVAAASPKNRAPTPAAASPKAASPKAPVAEVAAAPSPKGRGSAFAEIEIAIATSPKAASPKAASPKGRTSTAFAADVAASSPGGRVSACSFAEDDDVDASATFFTPSSSQQELKGTPTRRLTVINTPPRLGAPSSMTPKSPKKAITPRAITPRAPTPLATKTPSPGVARSTRKVVLSPAAMGGKKVTPVQSPATAAAGKKVPVKPRWS